MIYDIYVPFSGTMLNHEIFESHLLQGSIVGVSVVYWYENS